MVVGHQKAQTSNQNSKPKKSNQHFRSFLPWYMVLIIKRRRKLTSGGPAAFDPLCPGEIFWICFAAFELYSKWRLHYLFICFKSSNRLNRREMNLTHKGEMLVKGFHLYFDRCRKWIIVLQVVEPNLRHNFHLVLYTTSIKHTHRLLMKRISKQSTNRISISFSLLSITHWNELIMYCF